RTAAGLESLVAQTGFKNGGDGGPAAVIRPARRGEVVAGEHHRRTATGTPMLRPVPRVFVALPARNADVVDLVGHPCVDAHGVSVSAATCGRFRRCPGARERAPRG